MQLKPSAVIGRFETLLRTQICSPVHFKYSHTPDERRVSGRIFSSSVRRATFGAVRRRGCSSSVPSLSYSHRVTCALHHRCLPWSSKPVVFFSANTQNSITSHSFWKRRPIKNLMSVQRAALYSVNYGTRYATEKNTRIWQLLFS